MSGGLRVVVHGDRHVHLADHLAVLRADSGCEVVGVVPDHDLGYPSAIAAARTADAVVILSATGLHSVALSCLGTAVPVFVEKPLAGTASETRELAARIRSSGAPFATGMFLRCVPALRRLRALLIAGELGDLSSASLRFSHPGLFDGVFDGDAAAWYLRPEEGGTGGFADLAVHLLDALLWLRPGSAVTARACTLRDGGELVDVGGAALVDWSGVPTTLQAGWTGRPGGMHVVVEGSAGSAAVVDDRITVCTGDSSWSISDTGPDARDAMIAFLAGCRGRLLWDPPTLDDVLTVAHIVDELLVTAGRGAPRPAEGGR